MFLLIGLSLAVLAIGLGAGVSCSGEAGIQVSLRRISDEEEIKLGTGGPEQIAFTDFAFVVHFDSPVQAGDQENMIMVYRAFRKEKEWANTSVKVYAQKGTLEDARDDFLFPEYDLASEVPVQTAIIDE